MNRGGSQQFSNQPVAHPGSPSGNGHRAPKAEGSSLMRIVSVVLLFAGAILIVIVLIFVAMTNSTGNLEFKSVDKSKMQAVFLNGGQVYFGNIKDLNTKFMRLNNIYYLRVNQTVQPNQTNNNSANDISLVKLGCELHGPQDQMLINRDQIIFWENLKVDGQVAKAVAQYVKANPSGQKCDTTASTTPSTSTPTTTPTTAPVTTPTTTKKP